MKSKDDSDDEQSPSETRSWMETPMMVLPSSSSQDQTSMSGPGNRASSITPSSASLMGEANESHVKKKKKKKKKKHKKGKDSVSTSTDPCDYPDGGPFSTVGQPTTTSLIEPNPMSFFVDDSKEEEEATHERKLLLATERKKTVSLGTEHKQNRNSSCSDHLWTPDWAQFDDKQLYSVPALSAPPIDNTHSGNMNGQRRGHLSSFDIGVVVSPTGEDCVDDQRIRRKKSKQRRKSSDPRRNDYGLDAAALWRTDGDQSDDKNLGTSSERKTPTRGETKKNGEHDEQSPFFEAEEDTSYRFPVLGRPASTYLGTITPATPSAPPRPDATSTIAPAPSSAPPRPTRRSMPGAERVGNDDGVDSLDWPESHNNDDAGPLSPVGALARAVLVDDPVVAAEIGADRTGQLMQELEQERGSKRRQLWIGVVVGLVAVVVVTTVVILAMFFVGRGSDSTPSPTPAPTSQQDASLINLIQSRMSSTSFDDPTSPQRRALDWMSQDPFTVALNDDDRIVQRFALAVLYYSTNGPTTWNPNVEGWLQATSECDWGDDFGCADNVVVWAGLAADGLSGNIPREMGLMSSLTWLNIHTNNFEGTIPTELGLITSLTLLDIRESQLEGTIPSEIGNLSLLTFLNFRINDLEGTIPSELGKLTSLMRLNLSGNNLSGSIPSEFGLLTSLTFLNLSRNSLTSQLPTELGNLPNLTELYLTTNELSGSIPSSLCDTLGGVSLDCELVECDCCNC